MPTDRPQRPGDYEAARDHHDASREFAEAGEVQKSAHDADPNDAAQAANRESSGQAGPTHADEVPIESSPTTIAQPPKGN